MPDGIDLILEDHRTVETLFAAFGAEPMGATVGQVVALLIAHDDAEQAALYPLVGHVLGDAAAVERAALAHSAVKKQIDRMKFQEGPDLIASFEVLRRLVAEHVKEEEEKLLPALREQATPAQLEGLAARLLQAKQRGG